MAVDENNALGETGSILKLVPCIFHYLKKKKNKKGYAIIILTFYGLSVTIHSYND